MMRRALLGLLGFMSLSCDSAAVDAGAPTAVYRLVHAAAYTPFGLTLHAAEPSDYGFAGHEREPRLAATADFGARLYAAPLGRFRQIDPVFQPGRAPYHHVRNNPLNRVDPTGATDEPVPGLLGAFLEYMRAGSFFWADLVGSPFRGEAGMVSPHALAQRREAWATLKAAAGAEWQRILEDPAQAMIEGPLYTPRAGLARLPKPVFPKKWPKPSWLLDRLQGTQMARRMGLSDEELESLARRGTAELRTDNITGGVVTFNQRGTIHYAVEIERITPGITRDELEHFIESSVTLARAHGAPHVRFMVEDLSRELHRRREDPAVFWLNERHSKMKHTLKRMQEVLGAGNLRRDAHQREFFVTTGLNTN